MTKKSHILHAIHVTDRTSHAPRLQSLLTEYGCYISTRLGLHETAPDYCSPNGLIVLELTDMSKAAELRDKINALDGIEIKEVIFDHH